MLARLGMMGVFNHLEQAALLRISCIAPSNHSLPQTQLVELNQCGRPRLRETDM